MHGRVREGFRQRDVLILEPTRAGTTIQFAILTVLAGVFVAAALLYPRDVFPQDWRPRSFTITDQQASLAAAIGAVVTLLCLLGAVVNARRWHIARVVRRLSDEPDIAEARPDTRITDPVRQCTPAVPLEVKILKARRFRRPQHRLRHVRPSANVEGRPPMRIAYLRLFENQPRLRTFIQGPWREYGYVYFLRSAAAVTPAEYRAGKATGNVRNLFVRCDADLQRALGEQWDRVVPKGRYGFKQFGAKTIRVRDRYGSYPVRSALCHGSYWKRAIDLILDRTDLVVLDLSGYSARNAGIRYELRQVIDLVPIDRVLFLADRRSKKRFLRSELSLAWARMAAGSPNRSHPHPIALVALTDVFRRREHQTRDSTHTYTHTTFRLVAKRRQTRRVAAEAQRRIDMYAPAR